MKKKRHGNFENLEKFKDVSENFAFQFALLNFAVINAFQKLLRTQWGSHLPYSDAAAHWLSNKMTQYLSIV